MWSRVVEILMGCWLAMSPFIFRHPDGNTAWWINDFVCALLIVLLAGSSYWSPLRHAHLGLLAIAAWLVGFAYWQAAGDTGDTPPALQNAVLVGLLLSMFALIPNDASDPPPARLHLWQAQAREQELNVLPQKVLTPHRRPSEFIEKR